MYSLPGTFTPHECMSVECALHALCATYLVTLQSVGSIYISELSLCMLLCSYDVSYHYRVLTVQKEMK